MFIYISKEVHRKAGKIKDRLWRIYNLEIARGKTFVTGRRSMCVCGGGGGHCLVVTYTSTERCSRTACEVMSLALCV